MRLTAHAVSAARAARLVHSVSLMIAALCLLPAIEARAQDQPLRAARSPERLDENAPRTAPPTPRGMARSNRQGVPPEDVGRAKAAARQQFTKSFGELQASSQALLREHEAGQLKPGMLSKRLKTIQKCAKSLRLLLQLGEPEPLTEGNGSPHTPQAFDQSIRRLAAIISSFAHNPIHQNNKVFNTGDAARARADLERILLLSKTIEGQARNYTALQAQMTGRD
jgi:hypothetical protein